MTFQDLVGPSTPQADGYQYTLVGNYVHCTVSPMNFRWGITIDNSSYGLVENNVVDNWAGAGIATVRGTEVDNLIEHNFVINISGTGPSNEGLAGDGFWFRGPLNYVVNNVAADINPLGSTSDYGFDFYTWGAGSGAIPAYQGADPSVAGQSIWTNLNDVPLAQVSGNEVYAAPSGLTLYEIGSGGSSIPGDPTLDLNIPVSIVEGMTIWNVRGQGVFLYPSSHVTLDHLTLRDDPTTLQDPNYYSEGVIFNDYMAANFTLSNSDIEGFRDGFVAPVLTVGTTTVENTYFRNVVDILIPTMWTNNGGASLGPRTIVISNDLFNPLPGLSHTSIWMDYAAGGISNMIQTDTVLVQNYNQVANDNFQVYYLEQAPDYIVPESDPATRTIGAPVAGLTNQQAWDQYGIAIAGAVTPDELTRADVIGYAHPPILKTPESGRRLRLRAISVTAKRKQHTASFVEDCAGKTEKVCSDLLLTHSRCSHLLPQPI